TLTANHSTWIPIPLLDYQTLSNFECWIGLNVFLEEEQNESNNIQEWYQPLRNPFFWHTLSVNFEEYYNHKPIGDSYPGWWEGIGAEKPVEEGSRWSSSLHSEGRAVLDFEEGEEIEEWIVSPVFVPENNTELRFNFFINSWPEQNLGNDDVFEIMISTDCMNFEPLKVYDSAYVHPIGRVEDVYDLSAYEGEEVMIAFHGSSNGIADKYAILVLYDVYIGPALDTGIADNLLEEEGSLRVFPNPSKDLFYLDWGEKMQIEEEDEIIVTNAMGQIIYQATLSSILTNSNNGKQYIVDASDWEDGMYLLLWRYANQSYSQKLVKMGR
ncbi:MAG: T9SS type A sorting domain-containing protein, partial [Saprospiraceae bacterium]